jgi:hypothetical protein
MKNENYQMNIYDFKPDDFLKNIKVENNIELPFTYNQINKNFIIRVLKTNENESKLYSARTYVLLIGKELAEKHFLNVFFNGKHKTTFRLRRGLKIDFYSK